MSLIGHSEFGLDYIPLFDNNLKYSDSYNINHWLEQWYYSYNILSHFLNDSKIMFVCYEQLCEDNLVFKSILDFIKIKSIHEFDFRLSSKSINLDYDIDLYNKCLKLYNNLKT